MDELKCHIHEATDKIEKSCFYFGWKSSHFLTEVLCLAADETIPAAFYNVPGCCQDSQVTDWGYHYKILETVCVEC